ncbi:MAG: hypothetical protein JWO89_1892 [Verrucomicrobiaceae bacterium]|nr:hypothetical protein [Verrucomicrobiaceae bacterium]
MFVAIGIAFIEAVFRPVAEPVIGAVAIRRIAVRSITSANIIADSVLIWQVSVV